MRVTNLDLKQEFGAVRFPLVHPLRAAKAIGWAPNKKRHPGGFVLAVVDLDPHLQSEEDILNWFQYSIAAFHESQILGGKLRSYFSLRSNPAEAVWGIRPADGDAINFAESLRSAFQTDSISDKCHVRIAIGGDEYAAIKVLFRTPHGRISLDQLTWNSLSESGRSKLADGIGRPESVAATQADLEGNLDVNEKITEQKVRAMYS